MIGQRVPEVTLKTRVRDESVGGPNPFRWQDLETGELFGKGRHIVFALPGAFTPTCTTEQCPAYERRHDEFQSLGVDEVHCLSVNDAFVMYQWGKMLGIEKVRLLPDGSGQFTRRMGMLVRKDHLGFGERSWRYAMIVEDGRIVAWFEEPGINDAGDDSDPYGESRPEKLLEWLRANRDAAREAA